MKDIMTITLSRLSNRLNKIPSHFRKDGKWRSYLPWLIIALSIFLAVLLNSSSSYHSPTKEVYHYPVQVIELTDERARPEIEVLGKVENAKVQTMTAYFDGWVEAVFIEKGSQVNKGDRLFTINTDLLDKKEAEQRLNLQEVSLDINIKQHHQELYNKEIILQRKILERLDDVRSRVQELHSKQMLSLADIEQRATAVENQKLQVARLESKLKSNPIEITKLKYKKELLELQLKNIQHYRAQAEIKAPADGVILDVKAVQGQRVNDGSELLIFADNQYKRIIITWPESSIPFANLSVNQIETYALKNNIRIPLTLSHISANISEGEALPKAGLYFTYVSGSAEKFPLLGEIITVRLRLQNIPGSFAIPETSLYDNKSVFRVNPSTNKLESIPVHINGQHYLDSGKLQWIISSPHLSATDIILTTRLAAAVDGLIVTPSIHKQPGVTKQLDSQSAAL